MMSITALKGGWSSLTGVGAPNADVTCMQAHNTSGFCQEKCSSSARKSCNRAGKRATAPKGAPRKTTAWWWTVVRLPMRLKRRATAESRLQIYITRGRCLHLKAIPFCVGLTALKHVPARKGSMRVIMPRWASDGRAASY